MRERARDRDALLLTARELLRQTIVHAFERDEAQELAAALDALGGRHAPDPQRELDVVADRHVAEQRVVLEHEPDLALAGVRVRHVAAVQRDAAVIDLGQAGDRAQQRALAAAARSEQHEKLAVLDVERDVVDDGLVLIALGDLVEDDGHCGRP